MKHQQFHPFYRAIQFKEIISELLKVNRAKHNKQHDDPNEENCINEIFRFLFFLIVHDQSDLIIEVNQF